MATRKARKDRSDITVKNIEKKHGMPPGTIRNSDGRDTRGDKKRGTIRKAAAKLSGMRAGDDTGGPLNQANDHMERAWDKIYSGEKVRERKTA